MNIVGVEIEADAERDMEGKEGEDDVKLETGVERTGTETKEDVEVGAGTGVVSLRIGRLVKK